MDKVHAAAFVHPWVLPDVIVENDGVSCGDSITLYLSVIDGAAHVATVVDGCRVCREEAERMGREVSGQPLAQAQALAAQRAALEGVSCLPGRAGCAALPWQSLLHAFTRLEPAVCRADADGFGCDACVTSYRPVWMPEPPPRRDRRPGVLRLPALLWSGFRRLDRAGQRAQRFGRLYAPAPLPEFLRFANALTPSRTSRLKRLRLAAPLFNAASRNGADSPALRPLFVAALAQKTRDEAIAQERAAILRLMAERKLAASPVKGMANAGLYPPDWVRPSLDFDFVAHSFAAAMELAHELLVGRGYRFVVHGSVPFSIKSVVDGNGRERVIGHFHVERFIGGRHQVVADISFPGYPVGKTGLLDFSPLQPRDTGPLLPVIALLHMFKHECAFAKDANDLHLLLEAESFDPDRFTATVLALDAGLLAGLALRHLGAHGQGARRAWGRLRSHLSWRQRLLIGALSLAGWPDRAGAHFAARIVDQWRRLRRTAPPLAAAAALAARLEGNAGPQAGEGWLSPLGIPRDARCYLVPLAVFRRLPPAAWRPVDALTDAGLECVELGEAGLLMVSHGEDRLVLTPLGLFIPTGDWSLRGSKGGLARLSAHILACLGLADVDLHPAALGTAKPHLWLY